jgi:hypothetical protein
MPALTPLVASTDSDESLDVFASPALKYGSVQQPVFKDYSLSLL